MTLTDDQPDRNWLELIGFRRWMQSASDDKIMFKTASDKVVVRDCRITRDRPPRLVISWQVDGAEIPHPKTRGDVLRLCELGDPK